MIRYNNTSFIKTNSDRCRVCYTCVRECPAKAIRIVSGQADVIPERCISCGNCVQVCSQNAKQVVSSISQVEALLQEKGKVAACIAPSFPAEFAELETANLVAMVRALGFEYVTEVAYGADLVARQYKKLLDESSPDKRYIATSCPAIVSYIEKYHPELTASLAPIVSPMIAMARVLHKIHGDDLKIVFIGPCIAKKCEADGINVPNEVDAVLTFSELRQMFADKNMAVQDTHDDHFDPPHPSLGGLFALSGGMLQTAGIQEDLLTTTIVTTDGKSHFPNAITEFENGTLDARLLEVLACHGCIMGAGRQTDASVFDRRGRVSQYVRKCMETA
ncbi:MAG: 4Fe-4S binding protein, partial [Phycisphaerae bacterium]|nr:4Fe-4S binding protein [Phycisphaerae bacterium]